eukprot:GILK01006740.1.p1 GENE.GILK01006740.1~~GILK01006740.1.p1  ORF type:complete len:551 (+),score=70.44 GILK01006740.1:132-1655(+)
MEENGYLDTLIDICEDVLAEPKQMTLPGLVRPKSATPRAMPTYDEKERVKQAISMIVDCVWDANPETRLKSSEMKRPKSSPIYHSTQNRRTASANAIATASANGGIPNGRIPQRGQPNTRLTPHEGTPRSGMRSRDGSPKADAKSPRPITAPHMVGSKLHRSASQNVVSTVSKGGERGGNTVVAIARGPPSFSTLRSSGMLNTRPSTAEPRRQQQQQQEQQTSTVTTPVSSERHERIVSTVVSADSSKDALPPVANQTTDKTDKTVSVGAAIVVSPAPQQSRSDLFASVPMSHAHTQAQTQTDTQTQTRAQSPTRFASSPSPSSSAGLSPSRAAEWNANRSISTPGNGFNRSTVSVKSISSRPNSPTGFLGSSARFEERAVSPLATSPSPQDYMLTDSFNIKKQADRMMTRGIRAIETAYEQGYRSIWRRGKDSPGAAKYSPNDPREFNKSHVPRAVFGTAKIGAEMIAKSESSPGPGAYGRPSLAKLSTGTSRVRSLKSASLWRRR